MHINITAQKRGVRRLLHEEAMHTRPKVILCFFSAQQVLVKRLPPCCWKLRRELLAPYVHLRENEI
ncbi:hypothetical protein Krac_10316 [Ktedonobacter racemifer DSM 44963]|uniref:Uncharacterized protein n=1 Tax=Ktedonobacter racemifer DSM 44963 TaxID=485913 RepID=D6TGB4_KTERA|nr:hypothetical protein Krac_10316 [Ktedonobacter racemifer DSM 44963]